MAGGIVLSHADRRTAVTRVNPDRAAVCPGANVTAFQPAREDDEETLGRRDSRVVSVTQGIQTDQPGFRPVQRLRDALCRPLAAECAEVFCQGVNLRGGECDVLPSAPKNARTHAEKQQGVTKSHYLPPPNGFFHLDGQIYSHYLHRGGSQ